IDPELVEVPVHETEHLEAHQHDMAGEREVARDEGRELRQPGNRERMQHDPDLDAHAMTIEILQPEHRLFERSMRLHDVVVTRVDVGIERNAEDEIGMRDASELLREAAVE